MVDMPAWISTALLAMVLLCLLLLLLLLWRSARPADGRAGRELERQLGTQIERVERELRDELGRQAQATRADLAQFQQMLLAQSGDAVPDLAGLDVKTLQPRLNALRRYAQARAGIEEAVLYGEVFEPVFRKVVAATFTVAATVEACEVALARRLGEAVVTLSVVPVNDAPSAKIPTLTLVPVATDLTNRIEGPLNFKSVISSPDFSKLAAVVDDGNLHISTNGGTTWSNPETRRNWNSISASTNWSSWIRLPASQVPSTFTLSTRSVGST